MHFPKRKEISSIMPQAQINLLKTIPLDLFLLQTTWEICEARNVSIHNLVGYTNSQAATVAPNARKISLSIKNIPKPNNTRIAIKAFVRSSETATIVSRMNVPYRESDDPTFELNDFLIDDPNAGFSLMYQFLHQVSRTNTTMTLLCTET